MLRKSFKRVFVTFLCAAITLGFAGNLLTVKAFAAGEDEVTRAEWLTALVDTFDMTVEDDSMMPDNYFSDLDPSSDYYKDFLLAVQFGLVNVEAGDPVYPDEPATREFAASTLNFCLGFQLDEDTEFTFSDAEDVNDKVSAQVAVNRGWIALDNGRFLPDASITKTEKETMLADASVVWHSTEVDPSHRDTYKIKEGISEVPSGTEATLLEDGTLKITECPIEINTNDVFVVHLNDIPVAYKALSIEKSGSDLLIQTEDVDVADAFDELDIEGTLDGNAEFIVEPAKGVEMTVEEVPLTRAQKLSGKKATKVRDLKFDGKIDLGSGMYTKYSAKLSNILIDYKVNLAGQSFVKLTGNLTMSCTAGLSMDLLKDLDATIAEVGVPGVGGVNLIAEANLAGKVTVSTSGNLEVGVSASLMEGVRAIKSFHATGMSCITEVSAYAGVKSQLGLYGSSLPFKGYVYAKAGVNGLYICADYLDDKKPGECVTHAGWVSAEYGSEISCKALKINHNRVETIYDMNNSPYRVYHHYEDRSEVAVCTRPDDFKKYGKPFGYYTKAGSALWGSGWANGIGAYGFDENGEPIEIYTYEVITIDYEDYAKITGFYGNVRSLTIPETIDGYTVIEIGDYVFDGLGQIDSVNIPDTVQKIGYYTFNNCTSLSHVTLPDSLEEINERAFGGCTSLTYITIPKKVERADGGIWNDSGPFAECVNLKDVQFENGMTIVAPGLLAGCTGIEEITIPDTVTDIGDYSFSKAPNLRKVVMPDTVTKIGYGAFAECPVLSDINLSRALTSMEADAFYNDDSITAVDIPKSLKYCDCAVMCDHGPYAGCDNLKTVTFQKGTTLVASGLFAGCTGLEEISIPGTVTEIGDYSFSKAPNLRKVVMPDTVTHIGSGAFEECLKLSDINLSRALVEIGNNAFANDMAITSIDVPKSLERCGNSVMGDYGPYANCKYLKTVTFEEGTTLVASSLLAGCTGIEKIKVPETVVTIGSDAFHGATNLTDVTLPEGLVTIDTSAFARCTALEELKLTEKIETIADLAFENCVALNNIVIPESVKMLGEGAFAGCKALEKINIPPAIEYITRDLFKGDKALKTIEWNDKIERIEIAAFRETGFESIEIPDTVKLIEYEAFAECPDLKSVKLSDSIEDIESHVFTGCEALSDVVLSEGIKVLPESMFEGCASLQKIILPHKLETIGPDVFKNCTKFTEITIFRYAEDIDASAFSYPEKLTIRGIKGTYAEDFANENNINFEAINIAANTITLKNTDITMKVGDNLRIGMTVDPADYTDEPVWRTGNADVVTVEDGVVTAESVGQTAVRVSIGSVNATCNITVVQPIEYIDINSGDEYLDAGETFQLEAEAGPEEAGDTSVTWSTSDAKVATVSDTGLVTAVAKGTAEITATSVSNPKVSATCTITVRNSRYIVSRVDELESPHPYENNCSDIWIYTINGAEGLAVTFSEETELDDFGSNPDRICLYDASERLQGEYTGKELAGKTVEISGDTVMIRLISDEAEALWGFKVTGVEIASVTCEHSFTWTDNEDGTHTGVCSKCGLEETEAHTISDWSYDSGWHYGLCTKCDAEVYDSHDWKDAVIVKAPTLTQYGEQYYECSVCGYKETEELEPVYSGTCGEDVDYSFDEETGELYIYGSGKMKDYTGSEVSPFANETSIKSIVIDDGVTSIGAGAFSGASGVESISIPKSVTSIGTGALTGCSPSTVEYEGTAEEFSRISMDEDASAAFDGADIEWNEDPGEDTKIDISDFRSEIDGTSFVYDGQPFEPDVTVYDDDNFPLFEDDYKVTYSKNVNAGTARVTVTGIGDYTGTLTLSFKIKPAALKGLKLSKTAYVYTGSYIKPVPVKSGLVNGRDFKLTYSANKAVGKATVIASGTGNYTGRWTGYFKINPKATKLSKLVPAKKALTVKWKKQATQTTGYEIQYALNSKFTKGKKTVTVSKKTTVSKKIKKLKAKKKYYVRIRTYKKVSGVKYYSAWSKAMSAKTK